MGWYNESWSKYWGLWYKCSRANMLLTNWVLGINGQGSSVDICIEILVKCWYLYRNISQGSMYLERVSPEYGKTIDKNLERGWKVMFEK